LKELERLQRDRDMVFITQQCPACLIRQFSLVHIPTILEWARKGIRVLDVAPGYITTALNRAQMEQGALSDFLKIRIPGGAPGTGKDVAKLIAAILNEDIPFLSGETIYIDGAQGVAL